MAGMRRAGPLSGHWRAPPEHTQTVIAERITGRLSAIKRLSAEPLSDSGAEERTIPAGQARATHRHQPPNFCPKKWKYFHSIWMCSMNWNMSTFSSFWIFPFQVQRSTTFHDRTGTWVNSKFRLRLSRATSQCNPHRKRRNLLHGFRHQEGGVDVPANPPVAASWFWWPVNVLARTGISQKGGPTAQEGGHWPVKLWRLIIDL